MSQLMAKAINVSGQQLSAATPVAQLLGQIEKAAADFSALNDPNNVYVLSNIETD